MDFERSTFAEGQIHSADKTALLAFDRDGTSAWLGFLIELIVTVGAEPPANDE